MRYSFKIIYLSVIIVIIYSCEPMMKFRLMSENEKNRIVDRNYKLHVKTNIFVLNNFWIDTKIVIKNISNKDTLIWHPEQFKLSIHRKGNDNYNVFNKIYKNPGNIILPGKKKTYKIQTGFEDLKLYNNPKLLDETKYIIELDTIFCGKTKVLHEPITFRAK